MSGKNDVFRGQDIQSVLASILIAQAVICYLDKKNTLESQLELDI